MRSFRVGRGKRLYANAEMQAKWEGVPRCALGPPLTLSGHFRRVTECPLSRCNAVLPRRKMSALIQSGQCYFDLLRCRHEPWGKEMRRREFITLVGIAAAWPSAGHPQQPGKIFRIGFLWDGPAVSLDGIEAFRQGLRELGYNDGRNIVIEYRWANGSPERMRELAEELVTLKVDVIIAPSSIYTDAARRATTKIPIIFLSHADPLGSGHVSSLSRPGGNITGLSLMMTETNVKGLELLKELIPRLSRVAVIWDPNTPSHKPGMNALTLAGPSLGLEIQSVPVASAAEYERAFSAIKNERSGAVLVLSTPLFIAGAKKLAELSLAQNYLHFLGQNSMLRLGDF